MMKELLTAVLIAVCSPLFSQNKYLMDVEKRPDGTRHTWSKTSVFDRKSFFFYEEDIEPIGVKLDQIDLKSAKTDTSGCSEILFSKSKMAAAVINGKGKFVKPPKYTLYANMYHYPMILGQRLKTGNWRISLMRDRNGERTDLLPEYPDFFLSGYQLLLFRDSNGKYGLYKGFGELLCKPVFDTIQYLSQKFEDLGISEDYNSFENCFQAGEKVQVNPREGKGSEIAFIQLVCKDSAVLVHISGEVFRNTRLIYDYQKMSEYSTCHFWFVEKPDGKYRIFTKDCSEAELHAKGVGYSPSYQKYTFIPQLTVYNGSEILENTNGYYVVKKKSLITVLNPEGKEVFPQKFIYYHKRKEYNIFMDQNGKYIYRQEIAKPVSPEAEKMLTDFTHKVELIAWYKAYNDSAAEKRKTRYFRLGNQNWAPEDLMVNKFRNGDPLLQAKDPYEFAAVTNEKKPAFIIITPANEPRKKSSFLYNIWAIKDKRGLIPDGFKIPSLDEWTELMRYAGGDSVAGEFLDPVGFHNLGVVNSFGSVQSNVYAWPEENQTHEYMGVMVMVPMFGYKMNYSGMPLETGVSIRCIRKEKK